MKQTSETKCKWNSVQYMEEIARIQRHPAVDNLHESHHEEVHQQEGLQGRLTKSTVSKAYPWTLAATQIKKLISKFIF